MVRTYMEPKVMMHNIVTPSTAKFVPQTDMDASTMGPWFGCRFAAAEEDTGFEMRSPKPKTAQLRRASIAKGIDLMGSWEDLESGTAVFNGTTSLYLRGGGYMQTTSVIQDRIAESRLWVFPEAP